MLSDDQVKAIVDGVRAKYDGELRHLMIGDFEAIVRAPSRAEYAQFVEASSDTKKVAKAIDQLAKTCMLFPERAKFDALLETRPGTSATITAKILEMSGAGADVEEKKL